MVDAEGQRGMLNAYVLIQTEVGRAGPAQAIRAIEGVQWADDLAGPYDIIASILEPGLDYLGWVVATRIHAVSGVTRTVTCTVLRR
jgi:hypothetical protein